MMTTTQPKEIFLNQQEDFGHPLVITHFEIKQPICQNIWINQAVSIAGITSGMSNSHENKQCKNGLDLTEIFFSGGIVKLVDPSTKCMEEQNIEEQGHIYCEIILSKMMVKLLLIRFFLSLYKQELSLSDAY
jgi:hypothetical protein